MLDLILSALVLVVWSDEIDFSKDWMCQQTTRIGIPCCIFGDPIRIGYEEIWEAEFGSVHMVFDGEEWRIVTINIVYESVDKLQRPYVTAAGCLFASPKV